MNVLTNLWRRRPRLIVGLGYTAFLLFFALLALYPVSSHPGDHLSDYYDSLDSAWRLWWPTHGFSQQLSHPFDANIFYPFHKTMMFDELLFGETLLALPVYLLGGTPVLAVNWIKLLNFLLAGWGMYALARQWTGSRVAGVVAGTLYAFSAYRFLHVGHLGIGNVGWLPLIVFALDRLLRSGGRSWRWAAALAGLLTMQVLSGQNVSYFAAMLVIAYLLFALTQPELRRVLLTWGCVMRLAAAAGVALLLTYPFIAAYFQVQQAYHFNRPMIEIYQLSANLKSLLAAPVSATWLRQLTAPFAGTSIADYERSLFPGFVPLLLLPFAALRFRRWQFGGFLLILAASGLILSLGPHLMFDYSDSAAKAHPERGFPLPYLLLLKFVPGLTAMHGVARIFVLTTFALSLLGGWAVAHLYQRLHDGNNRQGRPRYLLAAFVPLLVVGLALFEQLSPAAGDIPMPTGKQVPPVYTALRQQPAGGTLEFPYLVYSGGSFVLSNYYQYFSVYHQQRIVNGNFASLLPSGLEAIKLPMRDEFPTARLIDLLRGLGVRYLVVHHDLLTDRQRLRFSDPLVSSELEQIGSYDSTNEPAFFHKYDPGPPITDTAILSRLPKGDALFRIKDSQNSMLKLKELIPKGSRVYTSNARRNRGEVYMAVVGTLLAEQGYKVKGYGKFNFGQRISKDKPEDHYDYAILYADENPAKFIHGKLALRWTLEWTAHNGIKLYQVADK